MNMSNRYAIVGVGYTPQGIVPKRTTLDFYLEACANAMEDAGLKRGELDGLFLYRHFQPSRGEREVTPYIVAEHLGIEPAFLGQDAN